MLDKAAVINIVETYAEKVVAEFSPTAVILYGSYAKGTANEESDIDVAVVFDNFKGDWLKTSAELWHITRSVDTNIEPILLNTANDRSGFLANIYKTGYVVYKAE
jgi:predicted nucleotidyltransferase